MNRVYKTIWNEQTGTYVAVSELSHARGKRSGSSVQKSSAGSMLRSGVLALAGAGLMGVAGTAAADTHYEKEVTDAAAYSLSNGESASIDGINYKASTTSDRAWGVLVHKNSTLNASNMIVHTEGNRAHGIQSGAKGSDADGTDKSVINLGAGITVSTTGDDSFALHAIDGSSISTTGASDVTINTKGKNGFGAFAESDSTITLNNTKITTEGELGHGLVANNDRGTTGGSISATNTNITTHGLQGHGVVAEAGGAITLKGGSVSTNYSNTIADTTARTKGQFAHGLVSKGEGSIIIADGTAVTTKGVSIGAYAEKGGEISFSNGSITTEKDPAARATGSGSKITLTNAILNGERGQGGRAGVVEAKDGARIELVGGSVSMNSTRSEANGVWADGNGTTLSVTGTTITTIGEYTSRGAMGAAINVTGGAVAELNNATLNYTGQQYGRGLLVTSGATVTSTNTTIKSTGEYSDAVHVSAGSEETILTLNGGTISASGIDSRGMSAKHSGSLIEATGVSITTSGDGESYGSVTENGGKTILKDSSITTSGNNVAGILLVDDATVEMSGTTVAATGESIRSQLNKAGQTQNIIVGSGSTLTKNNGTLLRVDRTSSGEDGVVNLTLKAGSYADGNIENYFEGAKDTDSTRVARTVLKVEDGAFWAGLIIDDSTTVVEQDQTITGDSGGNVTGNVTNTSNTTVAFNDVNTVKGSVSAVTNSTMTFQGSGTTTITGNLSGQTGSTLQFNNNAVIQGGVTAVGSTLNFAGSSNTIGTAGTTSTVLAASNSSVSLGSGSTTINGGVQLDNNSSLSGGTAQTPVTITGNVVVNSGATLGGNLNVAGALSGSGGTLSPGNSIGVQTYGSMAGFTGTYVAEVNSAGASDLIRISTGDVDLSDIDLQVRQENGNGGYKLNHDYTIVEASAGSITNPFKSEALDSSFDNTLVKLDPVKYDGNTVKVSLSVDNSKVASKRVGLSSNQNAALDGVLSVAGQNASADAALQSTDTAGAMNQLSGEVHASTQSALMNNSALVTRTISNRMRANVGAGMSAGAPVAQSSGSLPAGALPSSNAYPLWAEVVGSWSSLDDNGNAAKVKSDIAGLFLGGDANVGNGWRVGGALGFTDGKIKVNDRSSSSDVTSYTAALYGGNSWETSGGKVNFLAGAAYTRHDVDSRRSVSLGGNQTLKADYHVNTTQLFTELGYAIPVGQASQVEPYLGLAWLSQKAKGFQESGGSAALRGSSQSDDITTFTLGLRGNTVLDLGENKAKLFAGLGWRHATGDVEPSRRMSFVQGAGSEFSISGAPIAKDAAVVDFGAEVAVGKNAALGLGYSGQFDNGNSDSTGSLFLRVKF